MPQNGSQAPDRLPCSNCGAESHGRYCPSCGQKRTAGLALRDVISEAASEFLSLDGKVSTTLKVLVTRPGQLTLDFIAGRRKRHVSPIRLYLALSVLYFFLAAVLPAGASLLNITFGEDGVQREASTPEEARIRDAVETSVLNAAPHVLFAIVPVAGALTLLAYRRRQPFYVAHFYFAVHTHAFMFLTLVLRLAGSLAAVIADLLIVCGVPYFFIALHRFTGDSWPGTIVKGILINLLYVTVFALAFIALFWRVVVATR